MLVYVMSEVYLEKIVCVTQVSQIGVRVCVRARSRARARENVRIHVSIGARVCVIRVVK